MIKKENVSKRKIYLTGIMTGVLLALSFPPLPLPLLSFVAFVPLLFALDLKQYRKPFLLIYLTFFIYHGGANWWISSWQSETDPFLMLSGFAIWLVHPFFFFLPLSLFLFIRKKFGFNIAYTQIYNRLWVQAADISGVWGLSFMIVLINVIDLSISNSNPWISNFA